MPPDSDTEPLKVIAKETDSPQSAVSKPIHIIPK